MITFSIVTNRVAGEVLRTRSALYLLVLLTGIFSGLSINLDAKTDSDSIISVEAARSMVCPKPINLHETNLTPSSVTVNWDIVPGALGYRLTGGLAGSPSSYITPIILMGDTSNSLSVSQLCVGVSYEWRVETICDDGGIDTMESGYSPAKVFTTIVCGSPGTASTTVSGNSATLMWNLASDAIGYKISGQQQGGPTVAIQIGDPAQTQLQLNNLPAANFLWQVSSICALSTICDQNFSFGGSSADAFTIGGPTEKLQRPLFADDEVQLHLTVYPNPNDGKFNLSIDNNLMEGKLLINDLMGRQVEQLTVQSATNQHLIIDLSDHANGVYILKLISGDLTVMKRMLIER